MMPGNCLCSWKSSRGQRQQITDADSLYIDFCLPPAQTRERTKHTHAHTHAHTHIHTHTQMPETPPNTHTQTHANAPPPRTWRKSESMETYF